MSNVPKPAKPSLGVANYGPWQATSCLFYLGSHLITKNVHIPLSSTKRYFLRPYAVFTAIRIVPSTISRFSRFSTAIQRFSTAKCTLFHGQILFSRPYLDSKAKPLFRSHLAKRPLASFFAIKRPPRYWPETAGCSLQTLQTLQTLRNLPNRL